VDVLNRDMTLEDAREALRGLIGSKWEPASPNAKADSTANQCPP
jgi:hypothetical protein